MAKVWIMSWHQRYIGEVLERQILFVHVPQYVCDIELLRVAGPIGMPGSVEICTRLQI